MPEPTQTAPEQQDQPFKPPSAPTGVKDWMGDLGDLDPSPLVQSPRREQENLDEPEATPIEAPEKPKTPASAAAPAASPTSGASPEPAPEAPEKWPRTSKEWKEFRKVHKEREDGLQAKIKEYEAQVKEAQEKLEKASKEVTSAEAYEALKKERDEFDKRLQTEAVTRHPTFQKYFGDKTKGQITLAKNIVGPQLAEKFEKLLSAPDSDWRNEALESALLELGPIQQARIGSVMNALSAIEVERKEAEDNAQSDYQKLQTDKANQEKARVAKFEALLHETIANKQHPEKGMPAYQKREGDKAWNDAVDARINMAKSILTGKGVTPQQVVDAAFQAAALQPVLEQALVWEKENADLKAQIAKLTSATPRAPDQGRSNGAEGHSNPYQPRKDARPMNITKDWVGEFGELMNRQE